MRGGVRTCAVNPCTYLISKNTMAAAVEQVSPELKILRSQFSYLVNSISVSSILPEARDTLITVRDYEDCKAQHGTGQAEKLMECVEKAVIAVPEKFDKFVFILKKVGHKAIGDQLHDMRIASSRPVLPTSATATQLPIATRQFVTSNSGDQLLSVKSDHDMSRYRTPSMDSEPALNSSHSVSPDFRPDLKQLLTACKNVSDWHSLGLHLGLRKSQLRSIELEHRHRMRIFLTVFDVWLKSSPSASWSDLTTALRAMGEDRIASDTEATYLPSKGKL